MPPIKGQRIPRYPKSVKDSIINAIKSGERVQDLSVKYGIKRQTIYGFLYLQGKTMKKVKAKTHQEANTQSEKLRLIAFYCGVDRHDAMNACVDFYFKHLQSIVTSKIKGA